MFPFEFEVRRTWKFELEPEHELGTQNLDVRTAYTPAIDPVLSPNESLGAPTFSRIVR